MKYCLAFLLFVLAAPVFAKEPPQFVRFRPIIVSTYRDTTITGYFSVTVHVAAADREARERLDLARPALQDAFTRTAVELGQLHIAPDKRINFPFLVQRFQAAAEKALPHEKIRVYIVDASTRRV